MDWGGAIFLGVAGRFLFSLLERAVRSPSAAGLCWLRLSGSGKPFTASAEVSSERSRLRVPDLLQ